MANKTFEFRDTHGAPISLLMIDNGDGSYSVATGGAIASDPGVIAATIVTLTAATSAPLIAANSARKSLRWQNVGANPATVVSGVGPAIVLHGFAYATGAGEKFDAGSVPTNAFAAISTLGTTIIVWEQ